MIQCIRVFSHTEHAKLFSFFGVVKKPDYFTENEKLLRDFARLFEISDGDFDNIQTMHPAVEGPVTNKLTFQALKKEYQQMSSIHEMSFEMV